jgi:hypothetical protein
MCFGYSSVVYFFCRCASPAGTLFLCLGKEREERKPTAARGFGLLGF